MYNTQKIISRLIYIFFLESTLCHIIIVTFNKTITNYYTILKIIIILNERINSNFKRINISYIKIIRGR